MLLSTLWPAAEAFAQLSYEIVRTVHATITAPMLPELSKFERHCLIQRRVKLLGDRLGYEGRTEVSTHGGERGAPMLPKALTLCVAASCANVAFLERSRCPLLARCRQVAMVGGFGPKLQRYRRGDRLAKS